MGWQGTGMLTNGEHDELWRNAFTVIPCVARSLCYSNAIECVKGLLDCGKITVEDYSHMLYCILKEEGFKWPKEEN